MHKELRPEQVDILVGSPAVNDEFSKKVRELDRRLQMNGMQYREWETLNDRQHDIFTDNLFLDGQCATSVDDYVKGAVESCGCPDTEEDLHHHSPVLMREIEKQQDMLPDVKVKIGESLNNLNETIDLLLENIILSEFERGTFDKPSGQDRQDKLKYQALKQQEPTLAVVKHILEKVPRKPEVLHGAIDQFTKDYFEWWFKNQGKPHKPSHKGKPLLSKSKGAKKFKKGEWHNVGERAERTQLTNDWLEQVQKLPGVTADFSFATGAVRAIKVIFDDYETGDDFVDTLTYNMGMSRGRKDNKPSQDGATAFEGNLAHGLYVAAGKQQKADDLVNNYVYEEDKNGITVGYAMVKDKKTPVVDQSALILGNQIGATVWDEVKPIVGNLTEVDRTSGGGDATLTQTYLDFNVKSTEAKADITIKGTKATAPTSVKDASSSQFASSQTPETKAMWYVALRESGASDKLTEDITNLLDQIGQRGVKESLNTADHSRQFFSGVMQGTHSTAGANKQVADGIAILKRALKPQLDTLKDLKSTDKKIATAEGELEEWFPALFASLMGIDAPAYIEKKIGAKDRAAVRAAYNFILKQSHANKKLKNIIHKDLAQFVQNPTNTSPPKVPPQSTKVANPSLSEVIPKELNEQIITNFDKNAVVITNAMTETTENPKFRAYLLREAVTGAGKFTTDPPKANYLMKWDAGDPANSSFEEVWKGTPGDIKWFTTNQASAINQVRLRSRGVGRGMAMRIQPGTGNRKDTTIAENIERALLNEQFAQRVNQTAERYYESIRHLQPGDDDLLSESFEEAWSWVKDNAEKAYNYTADAIEGMKDKALELWEKLKKWIAEKWAKLIEYAKSMLEKGYAFFMGDEGLNIDVTVEMESTYLMTMDEEAADFAAAAESEDS
jgi:hypothetical protein